MWSKKLYTILPLLLLLVVGISIQRLWPRAAAVNGLEREVVKSLLQLGLITIVGGAAAAWYKEQERERDRRRETAVQRDTLYRDYLSRLGSAYRSAKLVRRRLRAQGLWSGAAGRPSKIEGQPAITYAEEMVKLNEIQLGLEELKSEAKHDPELSHKKDLFKLLQSMEHYLRDITGEYETHCAQLGSGHLAFSDLPHLDEFTDHSDVEGKQTKRRFEANFASAYGTAARVLAASLTSTADLLRSGA